MSGPAKVIQKENDELVRRTRDKWAAEIRAKPDLSLADRLTLAGIDQRIKITVSGVEVECRAPFSAEIREIQDAAINGAEEKVIDLLAYFCVDESLDRGFWSSGRYTQAQLKETLLQIIGTSAEEQQQLKAFRNQRRRAKPVNHLP